MLTRRDAIVGVCLLLTIVGGESARATLANFKIFKQVYPKKDPKTSSCKICHQGALGKKGDLNAYGLALQKLKAPADAKTLTSEDLKALEKEDSDLDGVSNLDEINGGTFPGDPASVPQKPAPSPAATQGSGK